MYCSDECEKQAFQQYHCYECEISEQLQDMNDHFIVVRSFFKALTICNNSIEELKEMITSKLPKKSQLTMFDFDFSSMDSNESQKNLILVMCSGVSDKDTRLHPLIEVLLKRHSVVGKIMDTHRDFIMDFMLKVSCVGARNYHEITGFSHLKSAYDEISLGISQSPFLTNLNHSCAPNVTRIAYSDKLALIVKVPISAGSQIFDNYGPHYLTNLKAERQEKLFKDYNFNCSCKACKLNYLMAENVKMFDKQLYKYSYDEYCKILNAEINHTLTPQVAINLVTKYFKVLQENLNKNDAESREEIVLLQEAIHKCLLTITNTIVKFP